MAMHWIGGEPEKEEIVLEGKVITIKDVGVLNLSDEFTQPIHYRETLTYTFETEDQAKEYYYKKR